MQRLTIRNLFKLSNGLTVVAVDKPQGQRLWRDVPARLAHGGDSGGQPLTIRGESMMARRSPRTNELALEVPGDIPLTAEQAQTGQWSLSVS